MWPIQPTGAEKQQNKGASGFSVGSSYNT